MGNRLQTMGWEFDREELCFNCRAQTIQRIKILPRELLTQCTNCGAEAHYAQHGAYEERKMPSLGGSDVDEKLGAWCFCHEALCPHCGAETPNEVLIDPAMAMIACEKCLFTRLYRFDAFDKSWRR
jgi:transcription elongation factor Elf1